MAERFSIKGLQEKCTILEAHVRRQKFDVGEDPSLEDYRPGGRENPARGTGAWVFFYAQLVRLCGKAEYVGGGDVEEADATVLDALRNEPIAVELVSRKTADESVQLVVYPKSIGALMVCHTIDWQLGWLGTKVQALKASDDPKHFDLLTRALTEISKLYGLLAWIVSHPHPGLPYKHGQVPDVPTKFLELDTLDFPRIAQAFGVVNAQRLQALDALLASQTGGHDAAQERPSWSVFVGSLAIRMNQKGSYVMWDLSLGELLAAIRTHGHAEAVAHEAAQKAGARDG